MESDGLHNKWKISLAKEQPMLPTYTHAHSMNTFGLFLPFIANNYFKIIIILIDLHKMFAF